MLRVIIALVALSLSTAANAQVCARNLIPTFTSQQATQLCARGLKLVEPTANFEAVAVAGTTQGDAAALSGVRFIHRVTGANGTAGVRLPAVTAANVGELHTLLNTTAGVLNVYPATGGTINGAAANAVFAALTGIKPVLCYVTAANTWICS